MGGLVGVSHEWQRRDPNVAAWAYGLCRAWLHAYHHGSFGLRKNLAAILSSRKAGKECHIERRHSREWTQNKALLRHGCVFQIPDPCCRLAHAYVTQQDDLIGTLTVQETIHYSGNLRLPDPMPKAEKRAIIESTIVDMGLQDCANTPIGNWHLRGLSGGERRHVSIALEILTRPRMLFLDEPTSGLDSFLCNHNIETPGKRWAHCDCFHSSALQ